MGLLCDPWAILCDLWSILCDPWAILCDPWTILCDPWAILCDPWAILCDPWAMLCDPWAMLWDPSGTLSCTEAAPLRGIRAAAVRLSRRPLLLPWLGGGSGVGRRLDPVTGEQCYEFC